MNDRVLGAGIFLGGIIGIGVYFFLVFLTPWSALVIQISAFAAVSAMLVIVAWIGYTLATTPPPTPLEGLDTNVDTEEATKVEGSEQPKEE